MGVCCWLTPRNARSRPSGPKSACMTNQAFAANLALYAKLAYAIDRTEPFRGGTTVHMSKRIEPPEARASAATERPLVGLTACADGSTIAEP